MRVQRSEGIVLPLFNLKKEYIRFHVSVTSFINNSTFLINGMIIYQILILFMSIQSHWQLGIRALLLLTCISSTT